MCFVLIGDIMGDGMTAHREPESFGHFMVTFVPKAIVVGIGTCATLGIIQYLITGLWYSIICASPVGCFP
jgi:hypothetical protein